ncbi:MAG: hypothetical protein LQ338_001246 [Usnochroma carphineum]|nr:MAG: hypothetical protein LQ338_001246 [Usnochroma carphineum]
MPGLSIAIIGAGWTGCHLALELAKDGHGVTLFDKQEEILSGVSGTFGIRLHRGPHYPRSKDTRDHCHAGFSRFSELYPDLIVAHDESIYADGQLDSLGQPSKVSSSAFRSVCHETSPCQEIDPKALGMENVTATFDLEEPSVVIGQRLRTAFVERFLSSSVDIHLACEITSLVPEDDRFTVRNLKGNTFRFDKVLNATGYQSLIPAAFEKHFPLHAEVCFQVCLGLTYIDQCPTARPISRIVMDGWFPCLMPMITNDERPYIKFVATHGQHTIVGSCRSLVEAEELLQRLTDQDVDARVREPTEREMTRFWPDFTQRFVYSGWQGVVQAKLKTRSEFRSAVTFEKDRIIYVFPGKISNVFDACDEIKKLLAGVEWTEKNGVRYASDGILAKSIEELKERPGVDEDNTGNLSVRTPNGSSAGWSSQKWAVYGILELIRNLFR